MPHVLTVLKAEQPDHFWEILRVDPTTFDKIVEKNKGQPGLFQPI